MTYRWSRAKTGSAHAASRASAPTPSISARSRSKDACDETRENGCPHLPWGHIAGSMLRFPHTQPLAILRLPAQSRWGHQPNRTAAQIEYRHPDSPDSEFPIALLVLLRIPARLRVSAPPPSCDSPTERLHEIPCGEERAGPANPSQPGL